MSLEANPKRITAKDALSLLAARHSKDVFVPECKTGPTQSYGGRAIRLDAWAMPRSWAHPEVHGYEIKVSRQDFLRDEKWPEYMAHCNCMWFVAPKSVIQLEELPAEVGLLEISKNGKRLFTRRKAVKRDIEIPEDLWRYVLMCRATISEKEITGNRSVAHWEEWLRQKKRKHDLGYAVRGKIGKIVDQTQRENERLRHENETLRDVREILEAAGIDSVQSWRAREELRRKIEEQHSGLRDELRRALKSAAKAIHALEGELSA